MDEYEIREGIINLTIGKLIKGRKINASLNYHGCSEEARHTALLKIVGVCV